MWQWGMKWVARDLCRLVVQVQQVVCALWRWGASQEAPEGHWQWYLGAASIHTEAGSGSKHCQTYFEVLLYWKTCINTSHSWCLMRMSYGAWGIFGFWTWLTSPHIAPSASLLIFVSCLSSHGSCPAAETPARSPATESRHSTVT